MKPTLTRNEIRTETADYLFKNGASASILKTERIEEETANPYFVILGTFIIFLISSYCLVQLLISQRGTLNEVQIRQSNVYRVVKKFGDD